MLVSIIVLGVALLSVLAYHAWTERQWGTERTNLMRELTNLAMSKSSNDLQRLRQSDVEPLARTELPEGFEAFVGL